MTTTAKTDETKFAWYDMRKMARENIPELVDTLTQFHYSAAIVTPAQAKQIPSTLEKIGLFENGSDLQAIKKDEMAFDRIVLEKDLFDQLTESGVKLSQPLGIYCRVTDRASLDDACRFLSRSPLLIVDFKDETKIPLEQVLAEAQHQEKDVQVITKVADGVDSEVVFGVLEKGSNGVLFSSSSIEEIIKVGQAIQSAKKQLKQELTTLTVTDVRHLGMGERVCIDTCSYLGTDEGMLVGSFSDGGILVCSETHKLQYLPLRPFRVNAGALHSYVMGANDRTAYLSDLTAGMELIAIKTDGSARRVPIGRIKMETRPLIQITAESASGQVVKTVLQEDWHVRVFGASGEACNVTTVKAGDKLLGYAARPGRHLGIPVDEWIIEK
ncbi:3-dehydroquinate synthase II [Sporolactobacillus spathodeae]|uniref:3-amino-4-hydroxybenzoic acid synthase n=1 Tax=Sporolactobacillus spathodeae TaxID=1465502 RepID=A0ABS2Q614_9BACL|nr:3-dehydroquinate synthase II [Sporolactobacillus spathodeae]MBM7656880.1 3-amino-4-hydroxybenzoic acid synthase [Sporolactobacillus spathodeae]